MTAILMVLMSMFGAVLVVIATVYLVIPMIKGLIWLIAHVAKFVIGMIADVLRFVGAGFTALFFVPLTVFSILIGRWSAGAHFGRAVKSELTTCGGCIYRVLIGHPARLLCLSPLTEGIENRIPEVMAQAPGSDKPSKRSGQYEGYTIVGSLPGGGSGARLYVAEPNAAKMAAFAKNGQDDVNQVVIKSFSTHEGSSLPQIVRESRALDAAKRMGLILEHDLADDRFHYVMRYVPGQSLGLVTQQLHANSDGAGLSVAQLREGLKYGIDLVDTLSRYHIGGLWHKDVKPDNIIIHDGGAHLVDFGLITPLRSAMTLTTHGTEYFRDPEMVRMALRGAKVHEVDGTKFDIYAAGAVLYAMVENSFPAHGGLSQINKRCPEALRWVIRRAMTDYDKRYDSAESMLADLNAIALASDPFKLAPVDLPSMGGQTVADTGPADVGPSMVAASFRAATPVPPAPPEPSVRVEASPVAASAPFGSVDASGERVRPRLTVTDWWTGAYRVEANPPRRTPRPRTAVAAGMHDARRSAQEQLKEARGRAKAARARMHKRRKEARKQASGINAGVVFSMLVFLGFVFSAVGLILVNSEEISNGIASAMRQKSSRAWIRSVEGQHQEISVWQAPGAAHVGHTSIGELRAVVLRDRSVETPEEELRADAVLDGLLESGVELFETGLHDRASELVASLKYSIGLDPYQSEEAAMSAREWMGEHPMIDMVVWMKRDDAGIHSTWVIAADVIDWDLLDDVQSVMVESVDEMELVPVPSSHVPAVPAVHSVPTM